MSTATIERTEVVTETAPLAPHEVNTLISLAASTEKVATVRGGIGATARESRAWSLRGDVD